MTTLFHVLVAVAFAAAVSPVTGQATMSAEYCSLQYIDAVPGCEALAAFAVCLASAPAGATLITAERHLSAAQEKTTGCDITVAPSFRVVDREVGVSAFCFAYSYFF